MVKELYCWPTSRWRSERIWNFVVGVGRRARMKVVRVESGIEEDVWTWFSWSWIPL